MWEFGAGEDKGQGAEPAGKSSPWRIIPNTCGSGSAQPQIQGLPGVLGRFHGIIPPRSSGTGEHSECHGYEMEFMDLLDGFEGAGDPRQGPGGPMLRFLPLQPVPCPCPLFPTIPNPPLTQLRCLFQE